MSYYKHLRILQVFTTLNRGGAESMIMNYYRNTDRSRVQFDFLVHRPGVGAFEEEIKSMGGNIYRLPSINPFNPKLYYKALDKFLNNNEYKYDVIHSHINTFSSFPLKIAKENNIRTRITHAHTTTLPLTINVLFTDTKEAIKILTKQLLKRNIRKYATHLFACGDEAGKWLYGKNGKFEVIPNAIDSYNFAYNEKTDLSLRKVYGTEDSLNIGHIGNFSHAKNYPAILSIFQQIKKNKQDSRLILIGTGGLKDEIQNIARSLEIEDSVIFMGVRSDIPQLLQMMDIFLFPSLYEGLPVTLIEAQAAGLKIFASDTITKEVALTDDIKFLSLDDKPEYWADQIRSILPYERKNNFEQIKQAGYDIKENARRLQEFYLNQASK